MSYGVSVVFFYTRTNQEDPFHIHVDMKPQAETMVLDFQPNTPNGLRTIESMLQMKYPDYQDIVILNLIPLGNDRKPSPPEDDME